MVQHPSIKTTNHRLLMRVNTVARASKWRASKWRASKWRASKWRASKWRASKFLPNEDFFLED